uniref:Uncharacterized protein n=1 Tax=Cacopsylla melanoneura TaxID=428564 RepID=A0A8D8SVD1_9HEMI
MDSFLSKVFNSKRKQVYNVDKSKKENLKKVNKNMHQMSPAVVTNKLRKEFGIYKPTSEFSTASYNIPCVPHVPYQNSIDSVDVIPHSFHQQEQNIYLVKCTQDQKRHRNKSLLFSDESKSQMGAESINKEFGIDEYETRISGNPPQEDGKPQEHRRPQEYGRTQEHGRPHEQGRPTQNRIVEEVKINIRKQTLDQQRPHGTKETDETSVEESSTNTSDVRKDSLFERYDDTCKQLNSFRCNGEFIFESRKGEHSKTSRENIITDTRKLNPEGQSTIILNDSEICSTSNERLVGDDLIKVKHQKENGEEIHDLSKFSITKKGRIKCKSPEKDKGSKCKKVKGDDGLSRHRNYHSMIILGGRHKSKKSHGKDMKISSNEMIASKKVGERDYMRWDRNNTSNIPESCCTVRTMYQNSSKISFSSCISPSEHTLKWLDENFGPGSKNTTLIGSDEHEEFPDYVNLDLSNQTKDCDCNKIVEIENQNQDTNAVNNVLICTYTNDDVSASNSPNNDSCKNGNDNPIDLESKEKIESDVNNNNEKKTVRVVSFKKSRTLKSSSNSTQKQLEEPYTTEPLQEIKHVNEENQIDVNSESIKFQPENIKNQVLDEELVEALETKSKKNKLPSENTDNSSDNQPKHNMVCNENTCDVKEVRSPSKPVEQITECDIIPSLSASIIECENTDDKAKTINQDDPSVKKEKQLDSVRETKSELQNNIDHSTKTKDCSSQKQANQKIATYQTNLNLQNENIFGILRAQEKRNIKQTCGNIDVVEKDNDNLNQECKNKQQDEKIVLKLNDKVMNIDDQANKEYSRNINMKMNKISKISDPEVIKKRHEELEKDYIMTRLELALNTKVIEKPEMAKYIMEKSQEVIQDFMEKTSENISKKLLAQNDIGGKNKTSDSSVQRNENNSVIDQKQNDELKNKIDDPVENTETIPEIMVKHLQNPPNMSLVSETNVSTDKDYVMNRSNRRDLNNISKIENVKIYRKENKVKPLGGSSGSHISINSIDNIMQNKNLLLEEIKSLKRGKK